MEEKGPKEKDLTILSPMIFNFLFVSVVLDDPFRIPFYNQFSFVEQKNSAANLLDGMEVMRNKYRGRSTLDQVKHGLFRFSLKFLVPHRKNLIDHQNLRSVWIATEKASLRYIPLEYVLIGRSINLSIPEKSMIEDIYEGPLLCEAQKDTV